MKIVKMKPKQKRFLSDYECEGCGNIELNVSGYDDNNFHDNVIPNMCKCGNTKRYRNCRRRNQISSMVSSIIK